MKYVIIALIWSAYCVLHSYLISIKFTNLLIRLLKKYYAFYRLFYIIISIALLIPVINISKQLDNTVIFHYDFPFDIIRYILLIGSFLMFFWVFFIDYDSLSFFGIRQIIGINKKKEINNSTNLKKSGLLGLTRHPMYFALIIILWCDTFKFSNIVINSVLTIYIIIGTILEERKLILEFGDSYLKYQKEVPMLIPFLKRKNK